MPTLTTTHHATAADYGDRTVLTLAAPTTRPALEWARAIIERAPLPLRRGLPPGWRVLGMDFAAPPAAAVPARVLGWPVVSEAADLVVLGAHSRLGFDARLSVAVDGHRVAFATAIRHGSRASRLLWRAIAAGHRATVVVMLRRAARELGDPSESGTPRS
ncbi:hypothetical protein SAMN05443575_3925 [Jatrophihabitans endophyticus]|uniref:DUF2867 domain-containing protein n=1 Tax=Jatrophihabitans endophyticus TaxID=1206085 RepID=A0A1M5T729_9ACTN|nr:hypothetical protein [Jatrophihabitans endophyticus]SHH46488.1 hypothetical protein SAMN05443575_3925 [Jatrophihabitans endophyticus]